MELCDRILCTLASNFSEQPDFFVSLLPARQVLFVVLFDFDGYEDLDADMKRELGDAGWWFDAAALTPEETTDRIIREARPRPLVN